MGCVFFCVYSFIFILSLSFSTVHLLNKSVECHLQVYAEQAAALKQELQESVSQISSMGDLKAAIIRLESELLAERNKVHLKQLLDTYWNACTCQFITVHWNV